MQKVIYSKFRTRPHANPLSDSIYDYPCSPAFVDWKRLFSDCSKELWLDLGCGYGGLLETLGPRYPNVNVIGMEIRHQVVDYVENRIMRLRSKSISFDMLNINPGTKKMGLLVSPKDENEKNDVEDEKDEKDEKDDDKEDQLTGFNKIFLECKEMYLEKEVQPSSEDIAKLQRVSPPVAILTEADLSSYSFTNIAVIRCNTMKELPNYFQRGSLSRLFILFPDPHFKHSNIRRRVVTAALLDEYAYILRPNSLVYTITDVVVLHLYMVGCFEKHPAFERVEEEKLVNDVCYSLIFQSTADATRADRKLLLKFPAVFRRV